VFARKPHVLLRVDPSQPPDLQIIFTDIPVHPRWAPGREDGFRSDHLGSIRHTSPTTVTSTGRSAACAPRSGATFAAASPAPSIVSGNTNATVLGIAERAANLITDDGARN
jgi:hypothetical protein